MDLLCCCSIHQLTISCFFVFVFRSFSSVCMSVVFTITLARSHSFSFFLSRIHSLPPSPLPLVHDIALCVNTARLVFCVIGCTYPLLRCCSNPTHCICSYELDCSIARPHIRPSPVFSFFGLSVSCSAAAAALYVRFSLIFSVFILVLARSLARPWSSSFDLSHTHLLLLLKRC